MAKKKMAVKKAMIDPVMVKPAGVDKKLLREVADLFPEPVVKPTQKEYGSFYRRYDRAYVALKRLAEA